MTDTPKPAYAFNYIAQIGRGQEFQITGSLPLGVSKKEIFSEFSKFKDVVEYYIRYAKLIEIENDVNRAERTIKQTEEQIVKLDKADPARKLSSNEQAARNQLIANLENEKFLIEKVKSDRDSINSEMEKLVA